MAEPEPKPDEHNGNRATVALVDAKMDTVLAEVRGGFKDLQRQLDVVPELVARVSALHERAMLTEARVTIIEKEGIGATRTLADDLAKVDQRLEHIEKSDAMQMDENQRKRAYRSGTLPMILLGLAGVVISALMLYIALNVPGS